MMTGFSFFCVNYPFNELVVVIIKKIFLDESVLQYSFHKSFHWIREGALHCAHVT